MDNQQRVCKNCRHWREKADGIGECTAAEEPHLDPLGVAYETDSCEGWETNTPKEVSYDV